MNTTIRQDAQMIIDHAIASALPDQAVAKALHSLPPITGNIIIVALGKAAWQMSKAASDALKDRQYHGICITK